MLIALATHPKDFDRAQDLLLWMRQLQPSYANHWILLIGAFTLPEESLLNLVESARACGFRQVVAIRAKEEPVPPWPVAANHMWRLAAEYAQNKAYCSWLWLEPDTAPMFPGWLEAIEKEYVASRKQFMGTIYDIPYRHMNGVGVYPAHIRKFNPLIFASEFTNMPFDVVKPELTLRHAHITKLIHRSLADPATNMAHTFPDRASLSIIPAGVALFHGCKDGTLIERLREIHNPDYVSPKIVGTVKPVSVFTAIKRKVTAAVNGANTFIHAGNIGDVVYALAAIKAFGGGDLIICPEQRRTAVCSVPINEAQFEVFKPLLNAQNYLRNVTFSLQYPSTPVIDLNAFRNAWVNHELRRQEGLNTLCKAHFWELGILDKFKDDDTWLRVTYPIKTGKIVIARSPRYNSPSFPWKRLVDQRQKDLLFVGLKSEHEKFERDFGKTVSFWQVTDLLEMGRLIAGAKACVMNQISTISQSPSDWDNG